MNDTLRVTVGTGYPVVVASDIWRELPAAMHEVGLHGRVHIIADAHMTVPAQALVQSFGAGTSLLLIPGGEASKDMHTLMRIYDHLLAHRIERRDVVVAFGGGVIGDIVGYAAATILRGVALVQMPTTLLAMVDSAVGGKTGMNHALGKNMIGAFHQPRLVYADVSLLTTLPQRELAAGWAEAIKHGVIRDAQLFADLVVADPTTAFFDPALVRRAVAVKVDVVNIDVYEQAERMLLNYGHTVGHAIEQILGYGVLLHGEAIAIGMHIEAQIAAGLQLCPAELVHQQKSVLERYHLPTVLPPQIGARQLMEVMQRDKKVHAGQIRWALPASIGHAVITRDVPLDLVERVLTSL